MWAVTAPELKCAIYFWSYLLGMLKVNCSLVVIAYTTTHYFNDAFDEKLLFPHEIYIDR